MRLWRRPDVRRTCLRCGTAWIVPRALARNPRASKWQRGISAPDRLGFRDAGVQLAERSGAHAERCHDER